MSGATAERNDQNQKVQKAHFAELVWAFVLASGPTWFVCEACKAKSNAWAAEHRFGRDFKFHVHFGRFFKVRLSHFHLTPATEPMEGREHKGFFGAVSAFRPNFLAPECRNLSLSKRLAVEILVQRPC